MFMNGTSNQLQEPLTDLIYSANTSRIQHKNLYILDLVGIKEHDTNFN